MAGWKRYDPALWLVIAIVVVYELVAHFAYHNQNGMVTISHKILQFEEKYGTLARVLVALAVVVAGVHLEGAF